MMDGVGGGANSATSAPWSSRSRSAMAAFLPPCRAHKLRNVLDYLPKDDKPQVKSLLRAAWKLDADKGIARIKKLAAWLDQRYPQAAASLLEGLEECFMTQKLILPILLGSESSS